MAKFKPFNNQVVVQPADPPLDPEKRILLPESAEKDPFSEGVVISAGPDCKPVLRGGERIVYNRHAAIPAPFAGQGFLLVKDMNIVGQITK